MAESRRKEVDTDPLEAADYRRLCAVLDDVLGARGSARLRVCLEKALIQHFGWAVQARIDGGDSRAAGDDTAVTEVLTLDADRLYVTVWPASPRARARQREVLHRLRRYLLPILSDSQPAGRDGLDSGADGATGQGLVLTRREREVTELVAAGLRNDQIAARMCITLGTVKKHLSQALAKNDCTSRTQLALRLHNNSGDHDSTPG